MAAYSSVHFPDGKPTPVIAWAHDKVRYQYEKYTTELYLDLRTGPEDRT